MELQGGNLQNLANVQGLFASNLFHTERFRDSREKQDASREKRDSSRGKRDASRKKRDERW